MICHLVALCEDVRAIRWKRDDGHLRRNIHTSRREWSRTVPTKNGVNSRQRCHERDSIPEPIDCRLARLDVFRAVDVDRIAYPTTGEPIALVKAEVVRCSRHV